MQNVAIDRKKTAEIDDWAADKQPGDKVCLFGTIKSLDDQTMTVTIDEIDDGPDDEDDEERDLPEGVNMGSDAAPVSSPPNTLGSLGDQDVSG